MGFYFYHPPSLITPRRTPRPRAHMHNRPLLFQMERRESWPASASSSQKGVQSSPGWCPPSDAAVYVTARTSGPVLLRPREQTLSPLYCTPDSGARKYALPPPPPRSDVCKNPNLTWAVSLRRVPAPLKKPGQVHEAPGQSYLKFRDAPPGVSFSTYHLSTEFPALRFTQRTCSKAKRMCVGKLEMKTGKNPSKTTVR